MPLLQVPALHGGPGPYTSVEKTDLVLRESATLTWWKAAKDVERGFCRLCGSSLFWADASSSTWGVAAGALISPTGLESSTHIFVGSKPDWYELGDDGLARKQRY